MNTPPKKRLPNVPQVPQALNAVRSHPTTPSAGRAKPITQPSLPATTCQPKRRPSAPEVYRPQPVPRVLQTKKIHGPQIPKTPQINNVEKATLTRSIAAPRPVPHKYRVNAPTRAVMQLAEDKKKSQLTKVQLTIGRRKYPGSSGGGHAEMNALDAFLQTCGPTKEEAFANAQGILAEVTKKVSCIGKEVCGSCTMVLKALGFQEDVDTEFSEDKSGGVAWGATKLVEEFMEYMGLGKTFSDARKAGAK